MHWLPYVQVVVDMASGGSVSNEDSYMPCCPAPQKNELQAPGIKALYPCWMIWPIITWKAVRVQTLAPLGFFIAVKFFRPSAITGSSQ